MTTPGNTTIQVSRQLAEVLRSLGPQATYEAVIRSMLGSEERAPMRVGQSRLMPFSKSVAAATRDEDRRRPGVNGHIVAAYIHFPSGTNALVDVRIVLESRIGEQYVVPTIADTFVALDNVTLPVDNLWVPTEEGDAIRVEWWNFDGGNPHRVPVEVVVRQEPRAVGRREVL